VSGIVLAPTNVERPRAAGRTGDRAGRAGHPDRLDAQQRQAAERDRDRQLRRRQAGRRRAGRGDRGQEAVSAGRS
jgi:hypothetical protein